MTDRYDRMDTAELLREMCRKLDAIEKRADLQSMQQPLPKAMSQLFDTRNL